MSYRFCNISLLFLIVFCVSCSDTSTSPDDNEDPDSVTDIDGNVYKTIRIGGQLWMTENLKVTRFNNGDSIPHITDPDLWAGSNSGAYSIYENDTSSVSIYGLLYNWYAVRDDRKIAPAGWHVPTDEEWKELEIYLGMSEEEADNVYWRGTDEGGKLKETGTDHWISPNTGATNESGFTALPAGIRDDDGIFRYVGYYVWFWTSYKDNEGKIWGRYLYNQAAGIVRDSYLPNYGYSVRCLKN